MVESEGRAAGEGDRDEGGGGRVVACLEPPARALDEVDRGGRGASGVAPGSRVEPDEAEDPPFKARFLGKLAKHRILGRLVARDKAAGER